MIFKRGKTCWCRFGVDGHMFRQSLKTGDWQEAKRAEKTLIAAAEEGRLQSTNDSFAAMPFDLALERFRNERIPYLSPTTARAELDHGKPLKEFFGSVRLSRITEAKIHDYVTARSNDGKAPATINKELNTLIGMLRKARLWRRFADNVKRLKISGTTVGRAMELDEKAKLLKAAEGNPRRERALLATLLALNTTIRKGELRKLQWRDVDWLGREVTVRRAKTPEGERVIPLNREAFDTLLKLRERAKVLFGDQLSADWYVFHWEPGSGEPDATRPCKGWRSAWRSMVSDAGIGNVRFHDLRHQAITELSEGQASDETIMSIAGHIDRRMMPRYSHIRKKARRAAVDALCGDTAQSNGTVHQSGATIPSQVLEKNGGDDETRTRDLCRDRAAF